MTELQVYRQLQARLPRVGAKRLVVITGARQVGKTTLARTTYPDLRYVSLDAVEDRAMLASTPARLWAEAVGDAILDEAQKEPGVFEKVKYAYDAGDIRFSALLGSAQIMLLQRVRETLAGRTFVYELWPLTLCELAGAGTEPRMPLLVRLMAARDPNEVLEAEPRDVVGDQDAAALGAARHLARWGGMPELLSLDDEDRRQWLRSYHDTYLQRDLADLSRLRDLEPFHRFQKVTALRTAGILSYADLARDAGSSSGTARNYLEYLRLSYQAILIPAYASNQIAGLVKSPKVFWVDVGILRHLTGAWGPAVGTLFETMVVAEVVKLVRTLALDAELCYYRTRSGAEIDLVVETPAGILCFEVKSRGSWAGSDFRTMRHLAGLLGERFLLGVVVLDGHSDAAERRVVVERVDASLPLWAAPFHRLLS